MRFILADAGRDWYEWQAFGEACEAARLSTIQAEAARLMSCHLSPREIASALSEISGTRVGGRTARQRIAEAEKRLKRTLPHLLALQRQKMRDLLAAMRNSRSCNPNIAIYREFMGVHDRDPVRFASRLEGECADDLMDQPGRFLKDLPSLLDSHAKARAEEEAASRAAG
jgi:hypothetical protein